MHMCMHGPWPGKPPGCSSVGVMASRRSLCWQFGQNKGYLMRPVQKSDGIEDAGWLYKCNKSSCRSHDQQAERYHHLEGITEAHIHA